MARPSAAPAPRRASLTLRDGRRLSYLLLGPGGARGAGRAPAGAPAAALHHHGWPSSSAEAAAAAGAAAAALGLRVAAFDRPGVGGSSFDPGMSFSLVAADAAELMDALGLESAAQIGTSGGAPHAAALGYALMGRLPAPLSRLGLAAAAAAARPLLAPLAWAAAARTADIRLTCSPWHEFDLSAITQPTLVIRGASDACVTHGMALHLAERIPGAARPEARAAAEWLAKITW
ncbi:MAG: Alpha/Beta hydrolase protein [Monoraphidium minutum]|nr:MAG: Alpha/Beta hydrolase protein [Monoraphidium minutum]